MPFSKFEELETDDQILTFFNSEFPDAVPLLGEENILHDFRENPKGSLISIKVQFWKVLHSS
jgi:kynurenine 3-monooxygenase